MRWCWTLGFAFIWLAFGATLAHAQEPAQMQCRVAMPQGEPMANRAATIASMEELPDSCLKSLMVECDRNAGDGLVDLGSAVLCSMGYEALLHKAFGGSFGAMLTWWQTVTSAPNT
jgi:hypothetical protein